MATEVIMPRVDMDMAEGKIAAWYVKNGDRVSKGQLLFDIETDKATMEVEAEGDGIIQGITGELGVPIPVGQAIAWLLAEGETVPAASEPVPAAEQATPAMAEPVAQEMAAEPAPGLRATPLARSLAREEGVDLWAVKGSGPGGRIVAKDVPPPPSSLPPAEGALHLNWLARHEGPPVVLLHGFGTDHGSWRPLAANLKGLPLVGVDLPNHGKSSAFAVRSFAQLAQAVLRRLAEEGIGDCHLIGHSLGAGVALSMSAALGARLRSLTLIAPAGLGPDIQGDFIAGLCRAGGEASLRPWLRELVQEERWLTGSFVATAWQQLESPGRRAALTAMAEALLPDGTQAESLRPQLQAVQVPAKVIWGTADRIIPARHGAQLPAPVGLHLVPGVGHLPQIEATELVAALVRQQCRAGA